MILTQFLGQIRDHYVERLARAAGVKANDPANWLVEHTFGPPQEPSETGWNLPMRMDLIPLENGEPGAIMVVQTQEVPSFKTITTQWGDLPLIIDEFTWEQCVVRVEGLDDNTDWEPLLAWFEKWFDAEGRNKRNASGLLGVIHAVFPPAVGEDGLMALDVDFGSAPVRAMEELFDALEAMGAQAIALGGPAPQDQNEEEEEAAGEAEG
jgi:hypothetical protein